MPHDIVVAGGGIAGLTATLAFAQAGFRTLCVDPAPPITERDAVGADLRTTAFLQPSQAFLEEIGVWPRLAEYAMPLQVMRIIDAGGEISEARVTKGFDAADISDKPFGWNLPNWLMRRELTAALDAHSNAEFRPGTSVDSVFTRTAEARVRLSDGTRETCKLVVAADGRGSALRSAAGIDVRTTRFGQKALAFAVTHPIPHENVSTEIHRTGGPFTLVPLPDYKGRPSSAIVWMEEGPKAHALHDLDVPEFEAAMSERSCHVLGPLTLASRRTLWPIIAQEAERLTAQRLALVAEAAHAIPPIGAQGLNMSLRDMIVLRDLAVARPDGLGDQQMLDAYHRARIIDVRARVAGITMLNRVSMMSSQPMRDLRAKGIETLYGIKPVRTGLMRMGLGAGG